MNIEIKLTANEDDIERIVRKVARNFIADVAMKGFGGLGQVLNDLDFATISDLLSKAGIRVDVKPPASGASGASGPLEATLNPLCVRCQRFVREEPGAPEYMQPMTGPCVPHKTWRGDDVPLGVPVFVGKDGHHFPAVPPPVP